MGRYALRKPWNCWCREDFKIKTCERFARKCNKTVTNVWQLKYGLLETGMADEPTIMLMKYAETGTSKKDPRNMKMPSNVRQY